MSDTVADEMKSGITGPRITIRKSIFFGTFVPVNDAQEAKECVKKMKKSDRKARHVAFAFRTGTNPVVEGMSDDGEPRHTAGLPLLNLLRQRDLTDILIAVTRYWGGIKLGPGNLMRAYISAADAVLDRKK